MASFFKMSMFDPEFIFMSRHCASLQKPTILPRFFIFTLQIIIRDREKLNKAGYTATSCGRVGRGGYARFPTLRLDDLYGPTNQPTDQPTDQPTNRRMDKASYRVACLQLKTTAIYTEKIVSNS